MDEDYDYIVMGTGLTECVLSGLLSVSGKKVLHIDRNDYYGGESASLNLEQLYAKFKAPGTPVPKELGRSRDYNVDLVPKFIVACGAVVKILLHTKVTRYLDFKSVSGSFTVKDNTLAKVPSTAGEALSSPLMSFFQKRKFKNFLEYVEQLVPGDARTYKKFECDKKNAADLFNWWGLDDDTVAFTGHSMALYYNDDYLVRPCLEMTEKVKLYAYSVSRYGNSPYIYPLYGLGGLPEGFSRLSAVHGGTYMLNRKFDGFVFDEAGKVSGIRSEGGVARAKTVIADPTYFIGYMDAKVRKVGLVATSICILSHPIAGTNDADSAQIILPGRYCGRKNDLYIACTSYHHMVAAQGKWVAVVSGTVEGGKQPHEELEPALAYLGKIDVEFFFTRDIYEPTDDGKKDNIFISRSYDAETHFESATSDIMSLFERVTGKPVDLSASPESLGGDESGGAAGGAEE